MASHGNFRRGQAEQGKRRKISTLSGNVTIVHPIEAVGLGQAVIAVAGNKIYHMAGLWDRMTQEEAEGQYLVTSIKSNKALTFGRVRPEEQMADSSRVGAIGTHQPKREVCLQYKGTVPQFRKDGTIYQIDQRRNGEVADESIPRQLRGSVPLNRDLSSPNPELIECRNMPKRVRLRPDGIHRPRGPGMATGSECTAGGGIRDSGRQGGGRATAESTTTNTSVGRNRGLNNPNRVTNIKCLASREDSRGRGTHRL